jgi:hypothetical protein
LSEVTGRWFIDQEKSDSGNFMDTRAVGRNRNTVN